MTQTLPTLKPKLNYLPELDSIRTLAVTMTLLAHFSPVEIPYMWYGVQIFFTISGFLITTILMVTSNDSPTVPRPVIIKNFMIRRVLRLFPIYYLLITIFWLGKKYFSLYLWKDEFTPYFFTYTPNFLIYKIGSGNALCFAHLWSLGVEEQFYLFWPWLLLFPPPKYRMLVIIFMILIALFFIFFNYTNPFIGALPFTNFHTLGVGAILACLYVQHDKAIEWLKSYRHLLFGITFLHLILVLIFFKNSAGWHLYREISLCSCTFSIVLVSIFGWKGFVGYITRNKQIQYLGTISYGIYLYHMPLIAVVKIVIAKFPSSIQPNPWLLMILCFGLTIMLAAFSYKYIEMPFLRLKRYFT